MQDAIKWERMTQHCSNGDNGKVGKYVFFTVLWDGMCEKDAKNKYKLNCSLPGLRSTFGNFETPKKAKEKAEMILRYWLKNTSLTINFERL